MSPILTNQTRRRCTWRSTAKTLLRFPQTVIPVISCGRQTVIAWPTSREAMQPNLVILRKNVVEARVAVGVGFGGALIVPTSQGFLLKEAGRIKYYDIGKLNVLSNCA